MYFCNMIFRHLLNMRSHPTWVRGLKLCSRCISNLRVMSHPTWVRGLKHSTNIHDIAGGESHPTWVRGLKLGCLDACHLVGGRTLRGCVD